MLESVHHVIGKGKECVKSSKVTYYCLVVCLFEFGEESCPFVEDLWGAGVDVLFLELGVNLDCNQKH